MIEWQNLLQNAMAMWQFLVNFDSSKPFCGVLVSECFGNLRFFVWAGDFHVVVVRVSFEINSLLRIKLWSHFLTNYGYGYKMRTKLWSRYCELKNTVIDEMNIYTKMMSHPNKAILEVYDSVVVVNGMTSIIWLYLYLINL